MTEIKIAGGTYTLCFWLVMIGWMISLGLFYVNNSLEEINETLQVISQDKLLTPKE